MKMSGKTEGGMDGTGLETSRIGFRKAAVTFSIYPLTLLLSIFLAATILYFLRESSYVFPFPVIMTIIGVFIAVFGAFWDFGAKKYVQDLWKNQVNVSENDITYINRQQLLMTIVFFGIGGLYALSGFIVFILYIM